MFNSAAPERTVAPENYQLNTRHSSELDGEITITGLNNLTFFK